MKKIVFLSFISLSFLISTAFAQDMKVKEDKMKMKDKGDNKMGGMATGNFKPTYSANFQIGNASHLQKIMDIWQDWDDNMLERHDHMADTITMYFADGNSTKGKAENLAAGKKYRGNYSSVKTILHAAVPLRSNDRNEDVVAVWGQETNTLADGKVEKMDIHEVWFFNKDGKISTMRQWTGKVK